MDPTLRFAQEQAEFLTRLDDAHLGAVMRGIGRSPKARGALLELLVGMVEDGREWISSGAGGRSEVIDTCRMAELLLLTMSVDPSERPRATARLKEVGAQLPAFITPEASTWVELSALLQREWAASDSLPTIMRGMLLLRVALVSGRNLGIWDAAKVHSPLEAQRLVAQRNTLLARKLELTTDGEGAAAATLRVLGFDAKTADRRIRGGANRKVVPTHDARNKEPKAGSGEDKGRAVPSVQGTTKDTRAQRRDREQSPERGNEQRTANGAASSGPARSRKAPHR